MNVYDRYLSDTGDKTKTVIVSTASPYKFTPAVYEAVAGKLDTTDEFELVSKLNAVSGLKVPDALANLATKEVRFNNSIDKQEMKEFVLATAK